MPEIKPFKGIRYNLEKIENLADVVTQPYDQITDRMERDYKEKSSYNFVRLVLTKYAEGHDRQKEYADAKRFYDDWFKNEIFVQDKKETIYPYWQEFAVGEKKYTRKGFICLVRLEELGKGNILPHEKTLSKPKADRLNLLRITQKDLEPVFLLYTDAKNTINKALDKHCKQEPLLELKDEKGVTHKIWAVDSPAVMKKITGAIDDSILVIADGHHRYETAYNYRNELKGIAPEHPANYKMITLVNIEDPGLVILPTHRLIKNLEEFSLEEFLKKTNEYFDIKKTDRDKIVKDLAAADLGTFGFYSPITAYILTLKSPGAMKKIMPDRSDEYRKLDVAILHSILIEKILNVEPGKIEDHVRYERGADETMRKVDSGEFQIALLMNPTRPEQVKDVAQNRERMPQKSTDFYPKLVSGLVVYDIAK
ncbi:MAG: DUF1015 domain-containing protein [candidate division WOR-3 bacterium]|nr:MAG: DUF1015 domain-containing protein [candidate division WOR-3 bacterium]